jgi:serine/threonine protein phosphatase PrpC
MPTIPPAQDDADATGEYPTLRARPPRVSVEVGAESDVGKVRTQNEDHYLVAKLAKSMRICRTSLPEDWSTRFADEEGHLMVVADGMGGAVGGERASRLAVETIEGFVLNVIHWFLHLGGPPAPGAEETIEGNEVPIVRELRKAFERADATVIARAQAEPRLQGMGTTLTMAYSVGTEMFLVHAGDSRAYLYRDGELRQITDDHTLVEMLVGEGVITREAARTHARRNVVTNVVGGPNQGVHTEVHRLEILDGDVLLLCSDGLTEPVDDSQIAGVLARHRDPEYACRRLVELAVQGGAPDNVTAVVARYSVR